ncbi:MAG TPA: hypothetical protein VE549_15740 [Myxococcaceae bacterium]|nr:hypothetical protein [Myxococcaceae bacterium]
MAPRRLSRVTAIGSGVRIATTFRLLEHAGVQGKSRVTVDLAPISIDLLSGAVADVDLPAAEVQARASGALGPLLCALGQFLEVPVQDVVVPVVHALIRAIDTLLL